MDIIEQVQDDETINMLGICNLELEDYEGALGLFFKLAKNYPKNHILLETFWKLQNFFSTQDHYHKHLKQNYKKNDKNYDFVHNLFTF